jgi:hypothetical protein
LPARVLGAELLGEVLGVANFILTEKSIYFSCNIHKINLLAAII